MMNPNWSTDNVKVFADGAEIAEVVNVEVEKTEEPARTIGADYDISGTMTLTDFQLGRELQERIREQHEHIEYMRRHFGRIKKLTLNPKVQADLFKGWKVLKGVRS